MFYYLSFLRPPPTQAQPFGTISITPQIANDLHTEFDHTERDIFYSWQQIVPTTATNQAVSVQTLSTKLTTWRQATAYKEIPVPVPAGVREGQAWRLVLSCDGANQTTGAGYYTIDLGSNCLGHAPFPVLSMPIRFSAHMANKGAVGKQEKIERVYALPLPISPHGNGSNADGTTANPCPGPPKAYIKVTEQTSFDLDKKIWDSGIGLSSWLVELAMHARGVELQVYPEADTNTSPKRKEELLGRLRDALFAIQPRCIIELGAGTGVVALMIGALRAAIANANETSESRIIATDLGSAIPLLEHNINANAKCFADARPEAMVLDWDDEVIPKRIQDISKQKNLDAIVMADVTYNTTSFPSLGRTLSNLARLCDEPPLMLLGYKERDASERTLWEILQRETNVDLVLIGQIQGAGGEPIEIWIGQAIVE